GEWLMEDQEFNKAKERRNVETCAWPRAWRSARYCRWTYCMVHPGCTRSDGGDCRWVDDQGPDCRRVDRVVCEKVQLVAARHSIWAGCWSVARVSGRVFSEGLLPGDNTARLNPGTGRRFCHPEIRETGCPIRKRKSVNLLLNW